MDANEFIVKYWDVISAIFGVAGAAIGALLTLLIKWGLDNLSKKWEFKRSLKKEFFLKKLESAGGLAAYLQSYIFAAETASKIISQTLSIENLSDSYFEGIFTPHIEKFNDILRKDDPHASSLYFDIENEKYWSRNDEDSYFTIVSDFYAFNESFSYLNSQYLNLKELGLEQDAEKLYDNEIIPCLAHYPRIFVIHCK